ncbi:MAG: hypothetical protein MUE68_01245 [Bacteroidetes bacterium]|jgi:hypothetical protein|nr:hypothetical protein [Bacteroidota bacterium]
MRISSMILVMLLMMSASALGQNVLLFENAASRDTVRVEATDYLRLTFKGYLGQVDGVMNHVVSVGDSSVMMTNLASEDQMAPYEVRIDDIRGFRRMPKLQPLIKPVANLTVAVGTIIILDNSSLSATKVSIYSAVATFATGYLLDLIFKDDIKFQMADGWTVRVVPVQP